MTPIYDGLMDEFYPERIEFDLDPEILRGLRLLAWHQRVPLEMFLQDVVTDRARRVLAGGVA